MPDIEAWIDRAANNEVPVIRSKSPLPTADIRPSIHRIRREHSNNIPPYGMEMAKVLYNRPGMEGVHSIGVEEARLHYFDARRYSPNATNDLLLLGLDPHSAVPDIVLTPEEWKEVEVDENGLPKAYIIPAELQHFALLEAAERMGRINSVEGVADLRALQEKIDSDDYPLYPNRSHRVFARNVSQDAEDDLLARMNRALSEPWDENTTYNEYRHDRVGYPDKRISRKDPRRFGIRGRVGNRARSMIEIVDMATGANTAQSIAMGAMCGHRTTITRSGIFVDPETQIHVARDVFSIFDSIPLDHLSPDDQAFLRNHFRSNVAIALGPSANVKTMRTLERFIEMGGSSATVHSIAPDEKLINSARTIRDEFGYDQLEMGIGVVPDIEYALLLAEYAEIIKFGHGPGTRCDSANVNTLTQNAMRLLVQSHAHEDLRRRTIVAHVGSNDSAAVPLYLGGAVGYVRAATGAVLEKSLVMLKGRDGRYILPNSGDASEITAYIETAIDPSLVGNRYDATGKMHDPEGVMGQVALSPNTPSMAGKLGDIERVAGNMLANCGVDNMADFLRKMADPDFDILTKESGTSMESSRAKNHTS